jgi:hypothetical protein
METKLSFRYDREADILHIDKCAPYAAQESEEVGDEPSDDRAGQPSPAPSRTDRSQPAAPEKTAHR